MNCENRQKSENRQKHEGVYAKYNEINHKFDFSWVYEFSLFSQAGNWENPYFLFEIPKKSLYFQRL